MSESNEEIRRTGAGYYLVHPQMWEQMKARLAAAERERDEWMSTTYRERTDLEHARSCFKSAQETADICSRERDRALAECAAMREALGRIANGPSPLGRDFMPWAVRLARDALSVQPNLTRNPLLNNSSGNLNKDDGQGEKGFGQALAEPDHPHEKTWACTNPVGDGCDGNHAEPAAGEKEKGDG